MDDHKFIPANVGKNKCDVCGKTRNAQAHRVAAVAESIDQHRAAVAARKAVDSAEVKLWVGWRIAHEAILRKADQDPAMRTLSRKLEEKKPDSVMDRHVRLTKAECDALDALAEEFEKEAKGREAGPTILSARTLRKRIAAAWS
jgi:hypothetical protein